MMNVIVKPLISEKMTRLTEAAANPIQTRIQRKKGIAVAPAQNRYGFVVDKRANKIQIKNAVEALSILGNDLLYGFATMTLYNNRVCEHRSKNRTINPAEGIIHSRVK